MEKPSVFIGSSTEGLSIAEAVFACLSNETKPKLWTHQLFLPGHYPMEVLEKQVRQHAFAILVASPDDQIIKRDVSSPAMRDNILLEFGLFAGVLGRKRSFFVCPSTPKIELPSDLLGIIMATYDAERIVGTHDEIAAAVQVPCQQIRLVIREEWTFIQQYRREATARIRSSEKGKAIERLHRIVTQLRDAIMIVQRDAFSAVTDEDTFDKVKKNAIVKVKDISESFQEDAELVGVNSEIQSLSDVTQDALEALPFPRELTPDRQATRQKIIDTGFGAFGTFLHGGDPFQHVENATTNEVNIRVNSLKKRYMEWWDCHYPNMEQATMKLQDKLFNAAMELASNPHLADNKT